MGSGFTVVYPGIVNQLRTHIHVCYAKVGDKVICEPGNDPDLAYPTHAIWDTGATNTTITKRAAEALGLKPISKNLVKGVNHESLENVYIVGILLPNNARVKELRVTECLQLTDPRDQMQCDVLLGMDILNHGDLAITNFNGQTVMSFRMPSMARIDFNQQATGYTNKIPVPVGNQPMNRQQRRQAEKKKRKKK